jgi:uncharacterized protein YgiM (DUF1202 family)
MAAEIIQHLKHNYGTSLVSKRSEPNQQKNISQITDGIGKFWNGKPGQIQCFPT